MKKRIVSLSVALCLTFGLFLYIVPPISVFAAGTGYWSYNGIELPALPGEYPNDFPYGYIFKANSSGNYYLKLSTNAVVPKSNTTYRFSACTVRNYVHQGGSWVFQSEQILTSTYTDVSINSFTFVWANVTMKKYSDSTVYLEGSEPVPLHIPGTPDYRLSFEGQTISIDYGESAEMYILVGEVNGTLSCEWYINDHLYEETFDFVSLVDAEYAYIQGWTFTPATAGTYYLRATVKNTLVDNSATITSGPIKVLVGTSDSGDSGSSDSETLGKLEEMEMDLADIQSAVDSVESSLGGVSDSLDNIAHGDSGVDSSVTDFNDVSDSFTNSLSDANAVIDSGVDSLIGVVSSQQMLGTAAALGSILTAAFVGNEISVCGISGNPFELAVIFFGSMGVIVLVITYVFRKRGGG